MDRATELMVELLESELLTAVGPYERRLTGDGESTPWSGLVVRIAPAAVVAARQRAVQDQPAAPTERDQRQLDQLLGFLTRPSMRAIAEQDFLSPWPQRITTPLSYFVHEQDEVEHRFTDQALEERRQLLLQACNHFLHQEAFNGFSSRVPGRRDGGWTPSDAEGHADREAVLERRRSVLSSAAKDVLDAYDTLIETAGDRGYSLEAMSAERLPRVEAFDREMDQL